MIDILIATSANGRVSMNAHGYILMWTNSNYADKIVYEKIVSWRQFTKSQAQDTIMLIIMIARFVPLDK